MPALLSLYCQWDNGDSFDNDDKVFLSAAYCATFFFHLTISACFLSPSITFAKHIFHGGKGELFHLIKNPSKADAIASNRIQNYRQAFLLAL